MKSRLANPNLPYWHPDQSWKTTPTLKWGKCELALTQYGDYRESGISPNTFFVGCARAGYWSIAGYESGVRLDVKNGDMHGAFEDLKRQIIEKAPSMPEDERDHLYELTGDKAFAPEPPLLKWGKCELKDNGHGEFKESEAFNGNTFFVDCDRVRYWPLGGNELRVGLEVKNGDILAAFEDLKRQLIEKAPSMPDDERAHLYELTGDEVFAPPTFLDRVAREVKLGKVNGAHSYFSATPSFCFRSTDGFRVDIFENGGVLACLEDIGNVKDSTDIQNDIIRLLAETDKLNDEQRQNIYHATGLEDLKPYDNTLENLITAAGEPYYVMLSASSAVIGIKFKPRAGHPTPNLGGKWVLIRRLKSDYFVSDLFHEKTIKKTSYNFKITECDGVITGDFDEVYRHTLEWLQK